MKNKSLECPPEIGRAGRRKILIVARDDTFSVDVIDYAIHLAERLDYDLAALSVHDERSGKKPNRRALKTASALKREAGRRGIHCDHMIKHGETGLAVEEVNHEIKRVELVITDVGVDREEVAREVTIPMFSVVCDSLEFEGGKKMESNQGSGKKRVLASTIGYGAASAALYAAVFMNSDTVMQYFTKGGMYAALPVATVFFFSFAHGAFASNLWSLLGIEAMKKNALHQVKREVIQKRKQVQKKPRTYAYVNPFHRIDR
jgi:hypothetical protein